MNFEKEIILLVKSKYPVIWVETIDEEYVSGQLYQVAENLSFNYYVWSLTKGLRVGTNQNSFYQSGEPVKMLKIVLDLINDIMPSIFVLKDFHKFIADTVCIRYFKDIISRIRNTQTTIVILSAEYKPVPEIGPYSAHIVGGYPDEKEIFSEINNIVAEFKFFPTNLKVEISDKNLRRIIKSLRGLSIQQVRNVISRCILNDAKFDLNDVSEIEKYKKEIFDREGILEYYGSESRQAIAGFENLKKWVQERKNSFFDEHVNLPPPKGMLILGVQGCGKSLAAKVIAGELGVPLYRLDLNRLYSKYIGETEENLRKALKTVERLSPVCLWIDEIEKIFAASSGEIDGGVSQRVLGTFLTWMQERHDKSFITATSNNIHNLPAELLRKGRFDEIFFVDLPSVQEREEIFKIHILKRNLDIADFDLKLFADNSGGLSGAEIESAVISALYSSSSANEKISTRHILEQIKLTRPLSVIKSEDINFLRNWAKERAILPV